MRTAAIALFAGLCLTSCSNLRPTVRLHEPQIIRVAGATRYIEVPDDLTAATPEPQPPVPLCIDPATTAPVLCTHQVVQWVEALRGALGEANGDKAAISTLKGTRANEIEPMPPRASTLLQKQATQVAGDGRRY